MHRLIVCLTLLWICSACSSESTTSVIVKINADSELKHALTRVEVEMYGSDESSTLQSHSFEVAEQRAGSDRFPFSFAIRRGAEQQFKIVVRGYEGKDATVASVESKLVAAFSDKQERYLEVVLRGACRNIEQPCEELDRTCIPRLDKPELKGSCGPVPEVETSPDEMPRDASSGSAGSGTGAAVSCQTVQACVSSDYPCENSMSHGFQCQGQFAQWPMPEALPGSKTKPKYRADGPVVYDEVTGLVWQRALPETYTNCTAAVTQKGDACSWKQAKAYCDQLELAGRSWRLPSKIELESLIVEGQFPALDTSVFSAEDGAKQAQFWSTSSHVEIEGQAWSTEFIWGSAVSFDVSKPGKVRCVSSVLTRAGTPKDRYVVDTDEQVVTDTATGLTWQSQVSDKVFEKQSDAVEYCRSLPGNFRLPGMKELLTTIDPTRWRPAVDPLLPSVPRDWILHSSSPCTDGEGSTFLVSTNDGSAVSTVIETRSMEQLKKQGESIAFSRHAWCVR